MTRARYRSQISLRFFDPTRDVSAVCKAIGLKPNVAWTKGDQRRTPKGTLLDGFRDSSYCVVTLRKSNKDDLPEQLARAVQRLKRHRTTLRRFTRTGGRLSFFIGWFLNKDIVEEIYTSALLKDLADLGIALHFDVYGNAGHDG